MPMITVGWLAEEEGSMEVARPPELNRAKWRETAEVLDILEDLAMAELWLPGVGLEDEEVLW